MESFRDNELAMCPGAQQMVEIKVLFGILWHYGVLCYTMVYYGIIWYIMVWYDKRGVAWNSSVETS